MGMQIFPTLTQLAGGVKGWQHSFDAFRVKAIVPQPAPLADIVNFGFNAPYLLVFEETEMSLAEAGIGERISDQRNIFRRNQ